MGIFLGWLILSVVVGLVAAERGHSGVGFFFVSVLLSPIIGLVLVLAKPNVKIEEARAKERESDRSFQMTLASQSVPDQGGSVADEIEKLLSLKDRGAITADEFAAEKAKALARSSARVSRPAVMVASSVSECDEWLASRGYRVKSRPDGSFEVREPLGGVATIPDVERLLLYTRQRQLTRGA